MLIQLSRIQANLRGILPKGCEDTPRCVLTKSGSYHTEASRKWIKVSYPKVQWSHWVWFKGMIPRHRFICWLAVFNKLSTKARQLKHGSLVSPKCTFCDHDKSRDHLFFSCSFASKIWSYVITKVGKGGAPTARVSILS